MNGMPDLQPLVSVIVPAFNAEATLRETIASALAGSYRNIEVIVIDDGSTDSTGSISGELAAADPRVQVHRRANGGLSAALNSGFALARGDYVARLDADDLWHPAKLDRQMALALREPELAFIYCWVRYVDGHGRVLRDGPAQRFPRRALCRGLCESLVGGGSSALIRRSAIAEAGGCDESMKSFEDLWLQLKISERHPVGFEPGYLVGYRIRPGSLTTDTGKMLRIWRVMRKRLKRTFPQVPRYVHRWAHARRCMMSAEAFAWHGRFAASAALLAEALWHDPQWTGRCLGWRTGRNLGRRVLPAAEAAPGPAFLDCDPDEALCASETSLGIERLESGRARKLAALDETLARGNRVGGHVR